MSRPFVVLDRDGTLIVECQYLSHPSQVELLPGVAAALRQLSGMGFGIVVATNQSGLSRGYFTLAGLQAVHQRLLSLLSAQGAGLDAIYHCPHLPEDRCGCRKPETGMVTQAAHDLGFDPASCFVVGDKACDIMLAANLGATSILVRTGYGHLVARDPTLRPHYVAHDLLAAAQWIRRHPGPGTPPGQRPPDALA